MRADWPGSNALASGLKKKCLADAAGERGSGAGDGGINVVEVLDRCLEVASSSPLASPFFKVRCNDPALGPLLDPSVGK
jgi:hypothetical protein